MFSATMPRAIAELAAHMLRDTIKVAVAPAASTVERVEQRIIRVDRAAKPAVLIDVLRKKHPISRGSPFGCPCGHPYLSLSGKVAELAASGAEKWLDVVEGSVAEHKFKVGQSVSFMSGPFGRGGANNIYTITQLLPPEGDDYQYRIKNVDEPHERVVKESQLDRVA
jgi:hypothetical protein